ncbi:MAG: hypothetical protein KBF57_08325 [Saprospiraceae bacterium]|jgi:hypothetical protein|nr:hypothetical protein [Saprospiraceae bacterium]
MEAINFPVRIILFCGVFLIGCKSSFQEKAKFKNNRLFSKVETEKLLGFLHQFDLELAKKEGIKKSELNTLYATFFKRIKSQGKDGKIEVGFDIEGQERLESTLDDKLKKELWANMLEISNESQIIPDTIYYSVINVRGRFFNFMKTELAYSNQVIKNQIKQIESAGDMTPGFFADIALFPEKYDILDDRIRLMIAIHYVGLNRGHINSINKEKNKK